MFQERLLERISRIERDPSGREALPVAWEVRSITRHLQRLLNTRQGGVPIAEDFGIPDFTNIPGETLTETAQELVKVIRQVINRYEPRLTHVQITFVPIKDEILALRFKIDARLARDERVPVSLETRVMAEGKVEIQE
jgi:type VI secretion system protein